jgi:peptide/nickel transport system substrate-binding protein
MPPMDSIVRVFSIVEFLAEQADWVGPRKLARELHLGPATASRFLSSLKELGYVRQDPDDSRYRLTHKWAWIAARVLDSVQIRSIVHPHMVRLAAATNETIHFVIFENDQFIYVDKVDSAQPVQMRSRLGALARPDSTAVGQAILAFLPEAAAERIIGSMLLGLLTKNPLVDPLRLPRELDLVREQGYAVDDEQNEVGIRAVAAPVFDHAGNVAGAVEICGWTATMKRDRIPELVMALTTVAAAVSSELGNVPPSRVRPGLLPEPRGSRRRALKKITVALDTEVDTLQLSSFKSDAAYVLDANTQEGALDYKFQPFTGESPCSSQMCEGKLAESWDLSPDGLTLTLRIRKGVTFVNGNPLIAGAVKRIFERYLTPLGGHSRPVMNMALGTIDQEARPDQIEVVGDHTLRLHALQRNPLLLNLLTTALVPIVDFGMAPAHAAGDDPWKSPTWMMVTSGTGPYRLGGVQPGAQWELEPAPNYWHNGAVKNGGIVVRVVQSAEARLDMLKRGELDVIWGVPFKALRALEDARDFRVISAPSRAQNYMVMNHSMPPFDKVEVRRAILHALPYRRLVEEANCGYASPLRGLFPSCMPTSDFSLWPYGEGGDLDRARELLANAGYPHGFDSELVVHEGKPADLDSALLIKQALSQLNINLSLRVEPSGRFFDVLVNRRSPLVIHYFYAYVNDPFYCAYFSLRSDAMSNFGNYSSPHVDGLIRLGFHEADTARRLEMSLELQRIFVDEAIYANLFSQHAVFAASTKVNGFIAHDDGHPRFWAMTKD